MNERPQISKFLYQLSSGEYKKAGDSLKKVMEIKTMKRVKAEFDNLKKVNK